MLILLFPSKDDVNEIEGVLIERSEYDGVHSKQIGFPGGERDDGDLDDDRLRPFDLNYNAIYDWLDPDMGGTPSPDNLGDIAVSGDQSNFEYDLDNDQIQNENDSFPLDTSTDVKVINPIWFKLICLRAISPRIDFIC